MVKRIFLCCLETEIFSKMLGKSDFGNPKNHVKSRGENEGFQTEGISPIHRGFLQTKTSQMGRFTLSNISNKPIVTREALIARIRKCIREIDQKVVVTMFENLTKKINSAAENGLQSLIK